MSTTVAAVNTLVGRPSADPVLRPLGDGRKVCDMGLAVNHQKDQSPLLIVVATFGQPGRPPARSTSARAARLRVTRLLVYGEWDESGTRRFRPRVVGRVQFGGRPDEQPQPRSRGGGRLNPESHDACGEVWAGLELVDGEIPFRRVRWLIPR